MKRLLILLLAGAALGLVAAGCGDDDDSGSAAESPATTEQTTDAPAAPAGGTVAIKMQNIAFDPKDVTVKVGQQVTWTNEDTVDHNVVANEGADFKSDDFGKGGTYSFTAATAGEIAYVCTLHPGMDATLTVTE